MENNEVAAPAVKLGTENLLKYVMLVLEAANVADQVGRAKGAGRYMALMQLHDELSAMSGANFQTAVQEFKDMDATEKADMLAKVKAKFDLVDDVLENQVEDILGIMVDADQLVRKALSLFKSFKKA